MLWVLKRTVSMRQFFLAPKTYVKTDGLENIYNFTHTNFVYLNLCIIESQAWPTIILVVTTSWLPGCIVVAQLVECSTGYRKGASSRLTRATVFCP